MLFIKKINNVLRLYIDYKKINEIIIKNNYLLLLFSKILKRFIYIKYFIKIIFAMYIIKYEFEKIINKKSFFKLVIINLNIK